MPTQTRFITVSGAASIDLSGVFEDLSGGTSYGTATNFKVGSTDLTGLFHASTSESDRANFNTKFLVNGTDLTAIFRRRGFSGLSITVQPQSQTKNEGETATFSITATTSTGTLSYQWKKWNGSSYVNVGTATSTTPNLYTTPTLTASDDGNQYICTVSNGTDSLDSSVVTLTVHYVTITDHPDSGGLNSGDALLLSVIASVNPIPSGCQWQFSTHNANSWSNIGSATGASYSKSLVPADEGDYRCVVSNSGASVTENSNTAYIEVFYQSNITTQPYQDPNPVVSNGTNDVEVKIVAAGKTTPTYQWQENISSTWTNLSNTGRVSNVTTSALKISDVEAGDDQRQFRCVLSNLNATNDSFPDTTSNSLTLTVNYVPIITVQPVETVYNNGNSASYSVTANGRPSPNYQWQRSTDGGSNWSDLGSGDETSINGITTSNLTFVVQAQRAGYRYRCVVSNSAGSVNSNAVELLVNPFISVNLSTTRTVTVASGQNTVSTGAFSITAYGSSLSYQWQKKLSGGSFTNVGTNSSSYTDSAVDEDENGAEYRCTVSTSVSGTTATSNTCTLTVNLTAISISSFLGNGSASPKLNEGGSLSYVVSASGSGTLNYNFYKRVYTSRPSNYIDTSVQNGSSNTYTHTVTQSEHDYDYFCAVSSTKTSLGTVNSSLSTLTVVYAVEYYYDGTWNELEIDNNSGSFSVDGGTLAGIKIIMQNQTTNTYQWQKLINGTWTNQGDPSNGNLIPLNPSENGDQYIWDPIAASNAGTWRCSISNTLTGSPIISSTFVITVVQYTLTVVNGSGGGTQNPGYSYSISANAAATGYTFSNWSGSFATFGSSTSSSTSCTITQSTTVTANYSINSYTLTALYGDITGGTTPYNSNNDLSGKTATYGSTYVVTARTYSGYTFSNWQVNNGNVTYTNGTSSTSSTINITIGAANADIEAIYTED